MEQSLADLLKDALSDISASDLDFENLNFDEKFGKVKTDISHENQPTKEDGALHQEATGEATVLSAMENKDIYMSEKADEEESDDKNEEEDLQAVCFSLVSMDKTPEEDYRSSNRESEEESSNSGENDEEEEELEGEDMGTGEKPGELLMSIQCSDEFCYDNKEDKIFAEGKPLAPESTENPQVRNEEQGESDEEVSYFGQVPGHGSETMIKGDEVEEDEQKREEETQGDSSDSEGMKIEQEENVLGLCFKQEFESPYRDEPVEATLEFPEISAQNLQNFIAEVETKEYVEKMKDFSGEEHQEAGESFADYPSDFSSCEYVEDRGQNQENNYKSNTLLCLGTTVTDITWMGREDDTDEEGEGYLYSRDLEMDADRLMSLSVATEENGKTKTEIIEHECDNGGEAGESDSYSSSDDEVQVRRRDEDLSDNMCLQDVENYSKLEDTQLYSESAAASSRWSTSDDHHFINNKVNAPDFNINWDFDFLKTDTLLFEDLLTTEDTDKAEMPPSDVSQCPAEDINSYSVVQREDSKNTSLSYQGSLDDGFFFENKIETSEMCEQGQLGDDEYEEERSWEQEQERIKAFYKFYDDSDEETGREERQTKVQFCAEPLSQVIHYETDDDSSDRDSLSSSTDGEEDLSSAETSEELREPDNTLQMKPAYDPPNIELPESVPESVPESDPSNTRTRKHKYLGMLKLMLKMSLVILMGLLMFWLATDQADWLSEVSFF